MRTQPKPTATSKSADGQLTIWTIGHSNRSKEEFLGLLKENSIEALVDVRSFPTSKIEHFKLKEMEHWLPQYGIEYVWLGRELGGYRHSGYKAHMRTKLFRDGIEKLLVTARRKRTCIVCMETNPKYCHRRYISAYLEKKVKVVHIVARGQTSLLTF